MEPGVGSDPPQQVPEKAHGGPGDLDALLALIEEKPGFPAFADNIRELLSILDNPYRPVLEIAKIILRDVSLSTAILRVVNSFYFQGHQRRVHTVSSAVMLLGFKEIRDLAVGLKLLENFKPTASLNQVKRLILSSFFMAMTAQEVAKLNRRFDTEEIFLTALLFNIGDLVAAYYFPAEYQKVMEAVNRGQGDKGAAARQIFKVSLEDLGQAMLKTWNLPEDFLHRLAELQRENPDEAAGDSPPRRLIQGLHKFSLALFTGDRSKDTHQRQEERLARSLGVDRTVLSQMLSSCAGHLQEMARILRLDVGEFGLQTIGPQETSELPPQAPGVPFEEGGRVYSPGGASPPGDIPGDDAPPDVEDLRCRLQVMQEINEAIASQAPIHQILMMILEGIFRSVCCDRVAFCLVDRQRTRVSGRFGLGAGVDELLGLLQAPLKSLDHALSWALQQGRGCQVDPASPADRRLFPEDFWRVSGARVLLVSPIVIDGVPVGVVYLDRLQGPPGISEAHRQTVRSFRDLAVIAIRQSSQRG